MRHKAVYPGTFDPVTFGHIDIIRRARDIFSEVIVAVADNPEKKPLFSLAERVRFVAEATSAMKGVKVSGFNGLVVDFARKNRARVLIRGLRAVSDFEYEFMMALTNRKLAPDLETVFLMPHESYSYISSRLLRQISGLGGKVSSFVPSCVEKALKEKGRAAIHENQY